MNYIHTHTLWSLHTGIHAHFLVSRSTYIHVSNAGSFGSLMVRSHQHKVRTGAQHAVHDEDGGAPRVGHPVHLQDVAIVGGHV